MDVQFEVEEFPRSEERGNGRRWGYRSVLLCLFGFLMYFKPAQPFLVEYFMVNKGFTSEEVFKEIFPIWTYSQLAFMIVFGVLAEFSRIGYYPVIVFGALCFLSEPAFMLWGESVSIMQVCEVVIGAGVASIQVFSAYTYTIVPALFFQKITSYTRMSFLIGTVTSSLLGQLLLLFADVGVPFLYVITAFTSFTALLVSFLLPSEGGREVVEGEEGECDCLKDFEGNYSSVSSSQSSSPSILPPCLPTESESESKGGTIEGGGGGGGGGGGLGMRGWVSLLLFKYKPILRLCCWLIISLPVHSLVLTYFQVLVADLPSQSPSPSPPNSLSPSPSPPPTNWNGFLFSTSYILAAFTPLIPSHFESFFSPTLITECSLMLVSAVCGGLLILLASLNLLLPLYGSFICYHCLFEFQITLVLAGIAKKTPAFLSEEGVKKPFAMTFSLCIFCGLSVQCLLQFLVGPQVWDLGIHTQFICFGFLLVFLSFFMFVSLLASKCD